MFTVQLVEAEFRLFYEPGVKKMSEQFSDHGTLLLDCGGDFVQPHGTFCFGEQLHQVSSFWCQCVLFGWSRHGKPAEHLRPQGSVEAHPLFVVEKGEGVEVARIENKL